MILTMISKINYQKQRNRSNLFFEDGNTLDSNEREWQNKTGFFTAMIHALIYNQIYDMYEWLARIPIKAMWRLHIGTHKYPQTCVSIPSWPWNYHQISNISRTFVDSKLVDHSAVVGASPACRRCSNCIFILDLTHGFSGLGKDNYKTMRETFKFLYLVRLILRV